MAFFRNFISLFNLLSKVIIVFVLIAFLVLFPLDSFLLSFVSFFKLLIYLYYSYIPLFVFSVISNFPIVFDFSNSLDFCISMFTFVSSKLKSTLFRPRFIPRRHLSTSEIQEITKNDVELVKIIDKGTGANKPFGHPGCVVSKSVEANVFTHSAIIPLNNGIMQKNFFASIMDLMFNNRHQYVTFPQKLISRPLNAIELSSINNFSSIKRCIGLSILMKHYPNAFQTLDKYFSMITPLNMSVKDKYMLMEYLIDTVINKIWQK